MDGDGSLILGRTTGPAIPEVFSGGIADLTGDWTKRKSRYTEEQIGFALKQAELGTAVAEDCHKRGVSEAAFFRRKQRFGGLGPSELREHRQFEEGNTKPKGIVADLCLDKAMLQEVPAKEP